MKRRFIAVAMGLLLAVCTARGNEIHFSGVVTFVVGSGSFSPPLISVGDTFSGSVTFTSSNIVLFAGAVFPASGLTTGVVFPFFDGSFTPISNGYSFDSGPIMDGLGGTDSSFSFEFHDAVNSFFAASTDVDPIENFQTVQGQILQFSVTIPENGGTILFLAISLMPLIAARINRRIRSS
jgi:hypothetical protein